ncbi:MAG: hypothetical protein M3347_03175 [Armatimonadota bacterium]|nr:hypothetical protein [Armatimonadota bacterium]
MTLGGILVRHESPAIGGDLGSYALKLGNGDLIQLGLDRETGFPYVNHNVQVEGEYKEVPVKELPTEDQEDHAEDKASRATLFMVESIKFEH